MTNGGGINTQNFTVTGGAQANLTNNLNIKNIQQLQITIDGNYIVNGIGGSTDESKGQLINNNPPQSNFSSNQKNPANLMSISPQ